jgi:hypothetical protein
MNSKDGQDAGGVLIDQQKKRCDRLQLAAIATLR